MHRELGGPGLIESVYEEAMMDELLRRGMTVERQLQVPIVYKGKQLGVPLQLDWRSRHCRGVLKDKIPLALRALLRLQTPELDHQLRSLQA